MSEAKPRRWFQIHLSTAVVMMLAAAAMVGLNFVPCCYEAWTFYEDEAKDVHECIVQPTWPLGWGTPKIYKVESYGEGCLEEHLMSPTGKERFGEATHFRSSYGWPLAWFHALHASVSLSANGLGSVNDSLAHYRPPLLSNEKLLDEYYNQSGKLRYFAMVIDGLAIVAGLLLSGVFLEFFLRRREARPR